MQADDMPQIFQGTSKLWKRCGSGQPQSVARCNIFTMLVCICGTYYRLHNLSKHDMKRKEAERVVKATKHE